MNIDIKSYVSACYNVAVCKSGENGIEEKYPLGTGMRKNTILDSWLETIPLILSTGTAKRFHMAEMIRGNGFGAAQLNSSMQIGKGTTPTNYQQRQLVNFSKETSYVRPFVTGSYYIDNTGLGMRTYSITYEYQPETGTNTYYEAGLKSPYSYFWQSGNISDPTRVPPTLLSPIISRFLFTNQSGIVGFASGFVDSIGNYSIFTGTSGYSGYIINNQYIKFTGGNDFQNRTDFQYGYSVFNPIFNGITGGFFSGINYPNSGSGILSGIIGYKNDLSGITANIGEYIKIKYDVSIRIPAIVNPVPVTGTGVLYGDFNGSGEIKLCGTFRDLFGNIDSNGYVRFINNGIAESSANLLPAFAQLSWDTQPEIEGLMWPINNFPTNSTLSQATAHFTATYVSGIQLNQNITGFVSGYRDQFGNFTGLHLIDISSGSSGYFLNQEKYYFPTGNLFSGFSGQSGFVENDNITFKYSGFSFVSGSGFSGLNFINSGYGVMTGIIGNRSELIPSGFPSINSGANMPIVDIGDSRSDRKNPLQYKGTAYDLYQRSTGANLQDKYIDREFYFVADYPNYDLKFGGIFFCPMVRELDSLAGLTEYQPNKYSTQRGYGWYWKFNNIQTKYQDQLLKLNFRFSMDRD
jgi:hypothetical protein